MEVASQKRLAAYVRSLPKDVSIPVCVQEALATAPPKINIKKCEEMVKKVAASTKGDSDPKEATVNGRRIAAFLHIQERYLNLIEEGQKNVEVRINQGKVKSLKKGDLVCFTTGNRLLIAAI